MEISHSKPFIGEREREYTKRVLGSSTITGGDFSKRFENELRNYFDSKYFFFTHSGTEALYIILKSLGIGSGDQVILPSYVCEAVFYAVLNSGSSPVLVDLENDSWVVSYDEIKKKITTKTKAIIVVYTFGIQCDIESIINLGIPVVEDICQSFGLNINGKKAGTFGIASFTSFHAIKCLTTGGEGGGIITSDNEMAEKIIWMKGNYLFNARITELQAAFGLAQMEQYNDFLARRQTYASAYRDLLSLSSKVKKTSFGMGVNYRFVVTIETDVDDMLLFFRHHGVHLRMGMDNILHKQFSIQGFFPNTEKMYSSTLSFPIYPALKEEEFSRILQVCSFIFK